MVQRTLLEIIYSSSNEKQFMIDDDLPSLQASTNYMFSILSDYVRKTPQLRVWYLWRCLNALIVYAIRVLFDARNKKYT